MIAEMDHIVLNAEDVETALAFYVDVLQLAPERVEAFHRGEAPFPSVRLNPATIIDFFPKAMWAESTSPGPGHENLNHFCITLSRADWDALQARLAAHDVAIEVGPVPRWGARGVATSIYFRDAEGTLVEARIYP